MVGSPRKEQRKFCISLLFNINISMFNMTYDVHSVKNRIGRGTSVTKADWSAELG